MNTRKLIDFYLPFPWNIHARILFFCIVGLTFFWLVNGQGNFLQAMYVGGSIMLLDAEIIYWVSRSLFNSVKMGSPRKITIQILWRVVVFCLMIIVVGSTVGFAVLLILNKWMGTDWAEAARHVVAYDLRGIARSLVIGAGIATFLFFFMLWQDALKNAFKAREQMLIYQSETLKNQVNPHFLFNSLNTLSSLIPTHPGKAEAFTLKLSGIYRYILENRDVETVALEEELRFVNDYYFLQKIRDEEKIELTVQIENPDCRILPISLQLLVENAFKHNVATYEKPLMVFIIQKGNWVEVRNNLQRKSRLIDTPGLGLKNLEERVKLNLGKSIEIKEEDNCFMVRMPLICKG
jgi:hypothetical protein